MTPLASLAVPSRLAFIPDPAVAPLVPAVSSMSGQTARQPLSLVQVTIPPASDESAYRVLPSPFTNTIPKLPTLAALITDPPPPEPDEAGVDPQAARTTAPAIICPKVKSFDRINLTS